MRHIVVIALLTAGVATACGGQGTLTPTKDDGGADVANAPDVGVDESTAGGDAARGTLDAADTGEAGEVAPTPQPSDVNAVWPGMGCGRPLPADQPMTVPGTAKGYKQYTVMGTGANLTAINSPAKVGPRTFWVRVPADYDPNRAYRVVYLGQGCGGYDDAENVTYPLYREADGGDEEAIYVALDIPQDMVNEDCYDNRDGPTSQEWEAFDLFHSVVDANYCVDNDHVYVAGYTTGGWLANMWGCYFAGDGQHPWNGVVPGAADGGAAGADGGGDASDAALDVAPFVPAPGPRKFAPRYHIAGQAAVSGGEPDNNPPCDGPVAAIWIHDTSDRQNPIAGNQAALRRVLEMNGCEGSPTAAWRPDPVNLVPDLGSVCLKYTACPPDHPVVFCTTSGTGRTDERAFAIPAFKFFFDAIEAAH